MTTRQVSLTDPFTPTAEKLRWTDTNIEAHREHLGRLEQTLEQIDGRNDHAGLWALGQLEAEVEHVRAALAAVPSVESERSAWSDALAEVEAAEAACQAATKVDALVKARAGLELAQRAAGVAFEAFKVACVASRLPSPSSRPLFHGWRSAFEPTDDLNRFADALDDFAPGGVTFAQSAAQDAAIGHAACDLAALPFIVARTDPESRTFRLFWHYACRRNSIDGAETYSEIFPAEAAE